MEYYIRASNYIYESIYYLYRHNLWLSIMEKQKTGYTGMLKAKKEEKRVSHRVAEITKKTKFKKHKTKDNSCYSLCSS